MGSAWSVWRIGASQYGVRHVSSRMSMNRAKPLGKSRAVDSIATSAPESGWRYSRRKVAFDRSSADRVGDQSQATAAGIGP